jgi:Xaa-Pro aminopeptidase
MQFDAIIASSFENVSYLAGTRIQTQRLIPDRLALVLWPRDGDLALVVCSIEESQARRETWFKDIRTYEEFEVPPIAVLAELIRDTGLGRAKIGIESHHLTAAHFEELRKELPQARFESCDRFLDRVRMVKSPTEVQQLGKAAQVTDQAIWDAFLGARPGQREVEVASRMQLAVLEHGAQSVAFCILTGDRTTMAHPDPSSRALQGGDVLRTDFGGMFDGYYSDLARTAVVGRATKRQSDTYSALWTAHNGAIASIRPGILARDVYQNCKDEFARNGLEFGFSHVGHSLGFGLHEYPLLAPHVEEPLVAGMVLAVESLHDVPEGYRFHVEDLVEVTDKGHRILSRRGDWDKILETGPR